MSKKNKSFQYYCQEDNDIVKIDIHCLLRGDVVLECVHLDLEPEREVMMFRIMFNTAFIRSNILMLNCENLDISWDSKVRYPKGFRAEVLFHEVESIPPPNIPTSILDDEEKGGLLLEEFSSIQELFGGVKWVDNGDDAALWLLKQLSVLNDIKELSKSHSRASIYSYFDSDEENNRSSNSGSLDLLDSEKVNNLIITREMGLNLLEDPSTQDSTLDEASNPRISADLPKTLISGTVDSILSSVDKVGQHDGDMTLTPPDEVPVSMIRQQFLVSDEESPPCSPLALSSPASSTIGLDTYVSPPPPPPPLPDSPPPPTTIRGPPSPLPSFNPSISRNGSPPLPPPPPHTSSFTSNQPFALAPAPPPTPPPLLLPQFARIPTNKPPPPPPPPLFGDSSSIVKRPPPPSPSLESHRQGSVPPPSPPVRTPPGAPFHLQVNVWHQVHLHYPERRTQAY